MAAGFMIPSLILKKKELGWLSSEWSEITISGKQEAAEKAPAPSSSPDDPNERRLNYQLGVLGDPALLKSYGITTCEDPGDARSFVLEEPAKLMISSVLPADVYVYILGCSCTVGADYSGAKPSLILTAEPESGAFIQGRDGSADADEDFGILRVYMELVLGSTDNGACSVICDSATGKILDLGVYLDVRSDEVGLNAYGILMAYAEYLGISRSEGFAGSIEGDYMMMTFGSVTVKLSLSNSQDGFAMHLKAEI